MEGDLFEPPLKACGDVALAIRERRTLLARGAESFCELVGEDATDCGRAFVPTHLDPFGVVPEVFEVEAEAPALVRAYDLAELFDEARLAVGRESHHLPLVAVVREAEELRSRRVEYASRVRVLHLAEHFNFVALSYAPHRRDEVAEAVNREQGGSLEGRDVEGAGEVCAVMLDVVELRPEAALRDAELTRQVVLQVAHLRGVGEPVADSAQDATPILPLLARAAASREVLRRPRRGIDNLLVQVRRRVARNPYMVDVLYGDARGLQAVLNRLDVDPRAMLEAAEAVLIDHHAQHTVAVDRRL